MMHRECSKCKDCKYCGWKIKQGTKSYYCSHEELWAFKKGQFTADQIQFMIDNDGFTKTTGANYCHNHELATRCIPIKKTRGVRTARFL